MFTGIVQGVVQVHQVQRQPDLLTLWVELSAQHAQGLVQGASVALDGVCLTLAHQQLKQQLYGFDVIAQTLQATSLATVVAGSRLNMERAARIGDEIGGHLLSGHIMGATTVQQIERSMNNCVIHFALPPAWRSYLLPKGFIGINGASLTLAQVSEDSFCVCLIPETLTVTTFAALTVGDRVNIEIDSQTQAIVHSVERLLAQRPISS